MIVNNENVMNLEGNCHRLIKTPPWHFLGRAKENK
jgi:hypothetical protein